MDTVFLVKVMFTDDETYANYETMAVCTDEVKAVEAEDELKKIHVGNEIIIKEVELNKVFG